MMKRLTSLLLLTCNTALANTLGFSYQNQPINPACIALLDGSLTDLPYITTINLTACQHSNAAYQNTLVTADESYYFYYNNHNAQAGEYRYHTIGKTTGGIYVLETFHNTGGTFSASNILLVRLVHDKQYLLRTNTVATTPTVNLTLIGYLLGGDRCTGGFASVQLSGNMLAIDQYQGPNATDCSQTKRFTINLTSIS